MSIMNVMNWAEAGAYLMMMMTFTRRRQPAFMTFMILMTLSDTQVAPSP